MMSSFCSGEVGNISSDIDVELASAEARPFCNMAVACASAAIYGQITVEMASISIECLGHAQTHERMISCSYMITK
jgi:hypothetical protein